MRKASPKKQKPKESLDEAVRLAKEVAATAEKVEFYAQASKKPPRALTQELQKGEKRLDLMIQGLMKEKRNLRNDLLSHPELTEETVAELEWSYLKAVSFTTDADGKISRIFAIPFLFLMDKEGAKHGIIEPSPAVKETLSEFIEAFVLARFRDVADGDMEITLADEPLYRWAAIAYDEQKIPEMHAALLEGRWDEWVDLSKATDSIKALSAPQEGWQMGMWPFAIKHGNEEALEKIDMSVFADEFEEQFEEIFDPSSEKSYFPPIDANLMGNEGARRLWEKHVELAIEEIDDLRRGDTLKIAEVSLLWKEGELAGVLMDIRAVEESSPEGEQVLYRKRIQRDVLFGESAELFGHWIMGFLPMRRLDYRILIGHEQID